MVILFYIYPSPRRQGQHFYRGCLYEQAAGKYYLQYAAPGTELATYGDGCYVGESPLGPFTYQAHNHVSLKLGGFMTGAGHGSTIEDAYGNLWHAATMRISVNANFERRIGFSLQAWTRTAFSIATRIFPTIPWKFRRESLMRGAFVSSGCCCPMESRQRRPPASPDTSPPWQSTRMFAPAGAQREVRANGFSWI